MAATTVQQMSDLESPMLSEAGVAADALGSHPQQQQQMLLPAGGLFLTTPQRADLIRWRARAAGELLAIQDGSLGRGWRVRKRAAYLAGFIEGATSRLTSDVVSRN